MNKVRQQLEGVRFMLQQAQRLADAEQCDATFKVPDGKYTPLTHATSMRTGIELLLAQINHLLRDA